MENQTTLSAQPQETPIEKVASLSTQIQTKLPMWEQRAARATAALSVFQVIDNDEQDAKAEAVLVKVRNTYAEVNAERLQITAVTDALKAALMLPEKSISATEKDSEFVRVKNLRDAYATKKAKEAEQKRKDALELQARTEEIARLNLYFTNLFASNVLRMLGDLRTSIANFLGTFTLENFDAKSKLLTVKPNIKADTFELWFAASTSLNEANKQTYFEQLRAQYTYERINSEYQTAAQPIIDEAIAGLPALKEQLIEMSNKNAEDAAAQQKAIEDARDKALADAKAEDERILGEKEAKAKREADDAILEANFKTQTLFQTQTKQSGTRVTNIPVIDCKPEEIVLVFSNVLMACFSNAKFPGYLKTDKKGNILPPDADGFPVYQDWAQDLLGFYAANCNVPIQGITLKEKITTSQKAARAPKDTI